MGTAATTKGVPTLRRELGLRDLTLFAVICIASTRWVPIAAHAGPSSIVLWLLAAVLFAAPLTVAVAALAAKYPGVGGLYLWTRQDFGAWHALLGFWSYWLGIAFLFPTAALLYARVGFSALGPLYAPMGESRFYLLAATLALIWIGLGSNLIGLKVGKWTENFGALATWAVGLLLVAVAWMTWMRRGTATPIDVLPQWSWRTVSFSAAIAFALSGMEGVGMMAGEIRDPERTIRRAGWIATAFAAAFYVLSTAALLVVLPSAKISELNGFAETADAAGLVLGVTWMAPLIGLLALTRLLQPRVCPLSFFFTSSIIKQGTTPSVRPHNPDGWWDRKKFWVTTQPHGSDLMSAYRDYGKSALLPSTSDLLVTRAQSWDWLIGPHFRCRLSVQLAPRRLRESAIFGRLRWIIGSHAQSSQQVIPGGVHPPT